MLAAQMTMISQMKMQRRTAILAKTVSKEIENKLIRYTFNATPETTKSTKQITKATSIISSVTITNDFTTSR